MPDPHAHTPRLLGYYVCAAIVAICALGVNLRAYHAIRTSRTNSELLVQEWQEQDFSYLEDDHPPTFIPPSLHRRNVALVTEETVHYWPNASQDWESMMPRGSHGFVRLGPQKRPFGLSMYHQLHCLSMLQQAAAHSPNSEPVGPEKLDSRHLHHCLNYLRQTLLCAANLRLEPLMRDERLGVLKTDGIGLEHRCRDWTMVRREVEANFERRSEDGLS